MHQSCTVMVQRTEHVVSVLRFLRCLMDSASAQEPLLYAGFLQLSQIKMRNAAFPLEKKGWNMKMEQNHIFRLTFFFSPGMQIYFDTQSPSTSKYWTGSSGKQSPPGFKQSINGHKRGKNSSIKPLAPQWRQPPCTLAVTEVSDDSQQACGCLQCRHVVRWICPQSL